MYIVSFIHFCLNKIFLSNPEALPFHIPHKKFLEKIVHKIEIPEPLVIYNNLTLII